MEKLMYLRGDEVMTHLDDSYIIINNLMKTQFILPILLKRKLRLRQLRILSKITHMVKDKAEI